MNRITRFTSALALSIALCMGMTTTAQAAVNFQDHSLTVTGAGSYTATDLFDNFKNVMPGDKLNQPVTVSNGSEMTVEVYLRVEAHDEDSNPLTYDEAREANDGKDQAEVAGQRDETVATMSDFLSKLIMTITNGESTIFKASPDQEAQLSDNVLLGELAPGESLNIDVALNVPIELGNEYANRVGEVDWVFTVEEVPEPLPDTGLPQTGDDLPVLMLAGMAVAAVAVALVAAFALRRRGRQ